MALSLRNKRKRGDSDYSDGFSDDDGAASNSSDQLADEAENEDDEDGESRRGSLPRKRRGTLQTKLSFIKQASSGLRTRASSRVASTEADESRSAKGSETSQGDTRTLRLRPRAAATRSNEADDGPDELTLDPDDGAQSDDSFAIVRSDLQPYKNTKRRKRSSRLKKARATNGSDSRDDAIGYEQPRRSGRATKNMTSMRELVYGDDDNYAPDEEKASQAPKVVSVKEIFPPIGPDNHDFKEVHNQVCDTCNHGVGGAGGSNRGALIYCQGCSNSYHKPCIGIRAVRDHLATKVGSDRFVLQCRFCVGTYQKRDPQAPNHAMCQSCHKNGASCGPFSAKKTSKQEEQLRLANGGEDPATPVDPKLVNNSRNVLFRCTNCRRAYHFEHLPKPITSHFSDVHGDDLRTKLLEEYSIEWKCKDCLEAPAKVQTLVAWRPKDREGYRNGQTYADFGHDDIEYLIKWEGNSYGHCSWMPGGWGWGATHATMRNGFSRRNNGENMLPRFNEKDAIPEEYLLVDIILSVTYDGYRPTNKETDLANAHKIRRIYAKFLGLGYEAAVWDLSLIHI